MCMRIQSSQILCDSMDCSPPGSSVHGIFQARILERVAISLLQGIFPTQGSTHVSCIGRWILYHLPLKKPLKKQWCSNLTESWFLLKGYTHQSDTEG